MALSFLPAQPRYPPFSIGFFFESPIVGPLWLGSTYIRILQCVRRGCLFPEQIGFYCFNSFVGQIQIFLKVTGIVGMAL